MVFQLLLRIFGILGALFLTVYVYHRELLDTYDPLRLIESTLTLKRSLFDPTFEITIESLLKREILDIKAEENLVSEKNNIEISRNIDSNQDILEGNEAHSTDTTFIENREKTSEVEEYPVEERKSSHEDMNNSQIEHGHTESFESLQHPHQDRVESPSEAVETPHEYQESVEESHQQESSHNIPEPQEPFEGSHEIRSELHSEVSESSDDSAAEGTPEEISKPIHVFMVINNTPTNVQLRSLRREDILEEAQRFCEEHQIAWEIREDILFSYCVSPVADHIYGRATGSIVYPTDAVDQVQSDDQHRDVFREEPPYEMDPNVIEFPVPVESASGERTTFYVRFDPRTTSTVEAARVLCEEQYKFFQVNEDNIDSVCISPISDFLRGRVQERIREQDREHHTKQYGQTPPEEL